MNKPLVIFGSGDIAELAHYYFSTDSSYDVAAFTVDSNYLESSEFLGLPVVAFEHITDHYPPEKYDIFIALSYSKLNKVRKERFLKARELGYSFASYISSRATILNANKIGDNCFILEDNTIQPFVTIYDNVTLWSGNHIGHHSTIHDHCFIASHVVVSGGVTIKEQCFIGVNSTIRDHITIDERSILGAGTLILKDTTPESLYIGLATEKVNKRSTDLKKI